MTQKTMAYDNPAYLVPRGQAMGSMTGSGGACTIKYSAFANEYVKSVTLHATVAPGANSVLSLIQVSGSSTTTTTVAVGTVGTALTTATSTNYAPASGTTALATLNQGDLVYVVNGTDTTGTLWPTLELITQPGAAVTQ
jgi:hypothetical protein